MKKLMLIAIVGMFAVTAFAQGRPGGRPGGSPAPRVEHRDPGPRKPQGGFEWTMFGLGITRDVLGLFSTPPPPPQPRVVREVVVTPAPVITTTPVVKEVVVEKPVVQEVIVEKTKTIKTIEPVIVGDKIYFKVIYTDGTTQLVQQK